MKRIFFLLLTLPLILGAQTPTFTHHLTGILPAYRGHNANYKISFIRILSEDANKTRAGVAGYENKKYPLIIHFHGQGSEYASAAAFPSASSITTAELNDLFINGLAPKLRYTTSELYNKRYRIPGTPDSTSFIYLFPQTWETANLTYPTYPYNMIKYAYDSLSDIVDLNRIYLVGLSLGGGAVMTALQDTFILERVAAALANCPGYININTVNLPFNYRALSRWGGGLILTHSTNDPITTPNPVTGEGSYWSDRVRDSLLKWKGITTLIYKRWVSGGHAIWDRAYALANANNNYVQSNGQNANFAINFHETLLSWSTRGRRKLTPYWDKY